MEKGKNYKINFYTQYHQFYIIDKGSPGRTDSENFWSSEAHKARLAMEEGIVGVGTECYGPVKAELCILSCPKDTFDISKYDHVVEGGLDIKTGILQILNCPDFDSELSVDIEPRKYRVRIYSSNLASVIGDKGDDFYKIEIWPDQNMKTKVLKQYVVQ